MTTRTPQIILIQWPPIQLPRYIYVIIREYIILAPSLPSPSLVPQPTAVLVPSALPQSPLVVAPGPPLVWTELGGCPAAASQTQGVCR